MKSIKTLGLAIVAAASLTVALGGGSAAATVLCMEYETPCPVEKTFPAGTTLRSSLEAGTSSVIKDTAGTPLSTCTGASWTGVTTKKGGKGIPVNGVIETMEFTGCSQPVVVLLKGQFDIDYAGPNTNGTLTFKETKLTVKFMGQNCVYSALGGVDVGLMTSDEETESPTVDGAASLFKVEGPVLCPISVVWEAKSIVTVPKPLYFKSKTVGE